MDSHISENKPGHVQYQSQKSINPSQLNHRKRHSSVATRSQPSGILSPSALLARAPKLSRSNSNLAGLESSKRSRSPLLSRYSPSTISGKAKNWMKKKTSQHPSLEMDLSDVSNLEKVDYSKLKYPPHKGPPLVIPDFLSFHHRLGREFRTLSIKPIKISFYFSQQVDSLHISSSCKDFPPPSRPLSLHPLNSLYPKSPSLCPILQHCAQDSDLHHNKCFSSETSNPSQSSKTSRPLIPFFNCPQNTSHSVHQSLDNLTDHILSRSSLNQNTSSDALESLFLGTMQNSETHSSGPNPQINSFQNTLSTQPHSSLSPDAYPHSSPFPGQPPSSKQTLNFDDIEDLL